MRRPLALAFVLLAAACTPAGRTTATPATTPATTTTTTTDAAPASEAERVVQAQLEAYNRRDIDAFVSTYAPDVRGYRYPDRPLFQGTEALRASYAGFFASAPQLHARILKRIVQGNVVIDHEEVTGIPGEPTLRAVAIYEVRDGRIQSVRFVQ